MQHPEPVSLGSDVGGNAREYRPDLATAPLILEVQRLLGMERRIERLVCRYLADLADRIQQGQDSALVAYADELHAARCFFGLGVRDTRERVRVGRALRQLPQVEAAFVESELSYSRVREVTRVAEPHTEAQWLELARTLDMRALERQVAAARASSSGPAGSDSEARQDDRERSGPHEPIRTEWLNQDALRVGFGLSAETWALLERALEGARRSAAVPLSDAEAWAAVARVLCQRRLESPTPATRAIPSSSTNAGAAQRAHSTPASACSSCLPALPLPSPVVRPKYTSRARAAPSGGVGRCPRASAAP